MGFFPKTGSKTEPTFTSQTAADQPRQLTQILKKDLGNDNFDFFLFFPYKKIIRLQKQKLLKSPLACWTGKTNTKDISVTIVL